VLLVLCKDNELFLVNSYEMEKKKQIVLKKDGEGVKLLNENSFLLYEEERDTELRSANAEVWVKAIKG
jgi:hypothetical protein